MRDELQTLAEALKQKGWKLVCAESCTGGGLAYYLTSLPGSSEWFDRAYVTYSNTAKQEMLGVSSLALERYGAVSEETAKEMVQGALDQSGAAVAVAITGVAGPDGGSPEKPVGTVWLAWKDPRHEIVTQLLQLDGNREAVREQTIHHAIQGLISVLR